MTSTKAKPSTPEEFSLIGEIQDAGVRMMSAYASLVTLADGNYSPKLVVKVARSDFTTEEHGDYLVVDISNAVLHPVTMIKPAK